MNTKKNTFGIDHCLESQTKEGLIAIIEKERSDYRFLQKQVNSLVEMNVFLEQHSKDCLEMLATSSSCYRSYFVDPLKK